MAIPDPAYELSDIRQRVHILEMAYSKSVLTKEQSPTRLELAENNLEACRKLNGNLQKENEYLRNRQISVTDAVVLENYRKVTKSLNLNGPGAIRKYVRSLEDEVQHLNAQIVDLEDARLTEDW